MSKYTINAPGMWWQDIWPAMEDRQGDEINGLLTQEQVEVVHQYWDKSRHVKRGKGTAHRFDLSSIEAVIFLRGEAKYRWDWNLDTLDEADDAEDRAYRRRCANAAKTLMDRCDTILKAES